MSEGAAVYVKLLGSPRVQVGKKQVAFTPDKRYQLLAYLAYQGDWVSRERAAFLFWPDTDNQNARQNLRGLLQRVRALEWLTDLETDAHQLRWLVETDVHDFKKDVDRDELDKVPSRYSGPFLQELDSDEVPEFSEWLSFERAHLHAVWREALFKHVAKLQAMGQDNVALLLLDSLLDHDQLDEEALRAFMHTAARAGQREKALRAYRDFEKRLREELSIETSSSTQQLAIIIEEIPSNSAPVILASSSFEPLPTAFEPPVTRAPAYLPTPATSFVGRITELAEIIHYVEKIDCRLLTLKGEGGAGKTRLALQVAHELSKSFPDGTHFVPLDIVTSVTSIPPAIASVLGIELRSEEDPLIQVVRHLNNMHLLLVLDNFEHLLEGAALISNLLTACHGVKLLVTSREQLILEEEWLFVVGGMAYTEHPASLREAIAYDAVQLFVVRAKRMQRNFSLSEELLPHVLEVCRLVDGSPLGIELAAVWVRALHVGDIVREIKVNLDFLSSNSRNVRERHQSVQAAFEHSWKLLAPAEQEALKELSVFHGGFTTAAAAAVVGSSVAMLAALLDKSLLRLSTSGRYTWHPLLHHYAQAKLLEFPNEFLKAKQKHGAYFLSRVEESYFNTPVTLSVTYLEQLRAEHDNLQGALAWTMETGRIDSGLRVAASLLRYWNHYGYRTEGLAFLTKALQHASARKGTRERALALRAAGALETNFLRARSFYKESALIFKKLGDQRELARTYCYLADAVGTQGEVNVALSLFEMSLKIFRELGDTWGIVETLTGLGHENMVASNYAVAQELLTESLTMSQNLGYSWSTAATLTTLGTLFRLQGDYEVARSYHQKSLEAHRELDNKFGAAMALVNLGRLAREVRDYDSSQLFLEQSLAQFQELRDEEGVSLSLETLGYLALDRKNIVAADRLLKKALQIFWIMGRTESVFYTLEGLAKSALAADDPWRAVHIFGATATRRRAANLPIPKNIRPNYECNLATARSHLGEDRFLEAWTRGESLELEHAVNYALC